ncbi:MULTISPECIES: tetratricopeptide repeat protein [unclassified Nocardiopsis]|uniref:tetratricopeptide repeat protein n=1 Tax=Nocardiopsis TaxID=2013 RepID=UPI00387B7857
MTVAVGIFINQVHPTDFDRTGLAWLIAALLCAGAAGALTHWVAPAPPTAPVPQLWPSVITRDGSSRLVGELSARDLGAHACRFAADAQNLYLERDVDSEVAAALADADQWLVIVSGPRLAGATRTLAHAAKRLLADHAAVAFLDDPAVSLQAMVEAAGTYTRHGRKVVLWLDALTPDRYTELALLNPAELPEGLRLLATLDAALLDDARIPHTVRDHIASHTALADLGALTGHERDRFRAEDAYTDLHPILDEGGDLLLGRLLVSWDQVRTTLTRGTGEEATDRVALLCAVTDWARIDPPRRLSRTILPHLYRAYRNALTSRPPGSNFSQYRYKQALAWVTTPTRDRPLLVDERTDGSGTYYTPHPLLTAIADQEGESVAWPVADQMWTYADTFFDGAQRRDLGYTALRLGAHTAADRLLGHGDADVDPYAMNGLATWFKNNDHPATARKWYTRAADTGHPDQAPSAMYSLGNLESDLRRVQEARTWFTRAIDTNHPDAAPKAMGNLGKLEDEQGRVQEARTWFTRAIVTGHPDAAPKAMFNLGVLEAVQGRVQEARTWYTCAIVTGHPDAAPSAMYSLGNLEKRQGRVQEARTWFTRAIDTNHPDAAPKAMGNLGVLEAVQGRVQEARTWFTRAIVTNHPDYAPEASQRLRRLDEKEQERHSADHYTKYGWEAYADPELMRRPGSRPHDKSADNTTGRVDAEEPVDDAASNSEDEDPLSSPDVTD